MPRRKRCDGGGGSAVARKVRVSMHHHDDSMDDGDLEDCGSPLSASGSPLVHPPQRNAANARERARMRVLSKAFCRLKTTLPWVPADTKLSKLDTLRLATSYIAHLRDTLLVPAGEDAKAKAPVNTSPIPSSVPHNPLNLTWPFAFPQAGVPGPEPWISRGASSSFSSRRTPSSGSSRVHGDPPGAASHCLNGLTPGSGLGSGSSSASSSGGDDDPHVDEVHEQDHDDQMLSLRGLSGGRLVELQQPCHYQAHAAHAAHATHAPYFIQHYEP